MEIYIYIYIERERERERERAREGEMQRERDRLWTGESRVRRPDNGIGPGRARPVAQRLAR